MADSPNKIATSFRARRDLLREFQSRLKRKDLEMGVVIEGWIERFLAGNMDLPASADISQQKYTSALYPTQEMQYTLLVDIRGKLDGVLKKVNEIHGGKDLSTSADIGLIRAIFNEGVDSIERKAREQKRSPGFDRLAEAQRRHSGGEENPRKHGKTLPEKKQKPA